MKTLLRSLCFSALLLVGGSRLALAQEPVSTGKIAGYQPKEGTMTIQSDQTKSLITFFGVDKANIFTADGKQATIAELPLGAMVTVQYAVRNDRWFVSKVILPAEMPARNVAGQTGLQVNAEPPTTRAGINANDGDVTTNSDPKQPKVGRVKTAK